MLTEESGQQLMDLGMLSKEQLDALYGHVVGEQAQEADSQKEGIAQSIAQAISVNPDVADVAQRVQGYAALPPASPAPIPSATPQPALTAAPTAPASAPAFVPALTPVPGQTNIPAQTPVATQASEPIPPGPARVNAADVIAGAATDSAANAVAAGGDSRTALEHLKAGINTQREGILMEADAAKAHAAQTAAIYAGAYNKLSQVANAAEKQQAELELKRQEQLDKQIAAVDSYNTLQIDPNHFWATRSTAQKIAAAIGIAFSVAGGGTKAFDVIDKAIKEDLDLQKENLNLKLRGLDVRNNLLTQMHSITGDYQQARQLAEASQINQAKLLMEQAIAKAGGAKSQAETMKALGLLETQLAEKMAKVQENTVPTINQASANAAGKVPTLPDDFNPAQLPEDYRKGAIRGVGIAGDPESKTRIEASSTAFNGLRRELAELKELRQKNGAEDVNSTVRARGNALWVGILNKIRTMEKFGALDEGSVQVFARALPEDPLGAGFKVAGVGIPGSGTAQRLGNAVMGDRLLAQIDQLEKDLTASYADKLKNNIIIPTASTQAIINGQYGLDTYPQAPGSKRE